VQAGPLLASLRLLLQRNQVRLQCRRLKLLLLLLVGLLPNLGPARW